MKTADELLTQALGVLDSEYDGTDCHQELIEDIRAYLAAQKELTPIKYPYWIGE